jgi:hypothetical protein
MATLDHIDGLWQVLTAQQQLKRDRAHGWDALHDIFNAARPPHSAVNGTYAGRFLAIRFFPVFTQLVNLVASTWMLWKGKTFDAEHNLGENILSRESYWPVRVVLPFYRGYTRVGPQTYQGFAFRTSFATSIGNPSKHVFRLDYDIPANPAFTVRRIMDELVQVDDDAFLGRAYIHWWWGRWQLWAYFLLTRWES